ncbi:MAG: hypothetical protein R6X20_09010 [Phycisphaerae bacterium]
MRDELSEEQGTYEARKDELLARAAGKFALIKGREVVDVFDSAEDAIRHGYERFGNVPFLVKQIVEVETPQNFTTNLLGV